ncbi:Diacylglycerol O-acyltransferase 2 [Chytridiales sp. JEL 0842]|nr:Diacylglycerol O-acyltransferase 2 [Chytridiales sp. JEL 0842]
MASTANAPASKWDPTDAKESPTSNKHTSGLPGVSYKPLAIYPPPEFQYKSNPLLEIPIISFAIFVPVFAMVVLPWIFIIACIVYPTTVLPVMVAYWFYTLQISKAHSRGGWKSGGFAIWYHKLPIWNYFRQHFKARIVKTAELPPTKDYILAVHPHGLYSLSQFANMTSNQTKLAEIFPGITLWLTTLPNNYQVPLWREFILSLRSVSVERSSLLKLLKPTPKKKADGKAVSIVVGGGAEFLHMEPHTLDLVLKNRKGFVKLALTTGCSLVPVLCFGENEVYIRHDTAFSRAISKFTYSLGRFQFPVVTGRWGTLFPKKAELVTVVGPPIDVDLVEKPSQEQVDELHRKYLSHLRGLYDEYKDVYHKDRKREMRKLQHLLSHTLINIAHTFTHDTKKNQPDFEGACLAAFRNQIQPMLHFTDTDQLIQSKHSQLKASASSASHSAMATGAKKPTKAFERSGDENEAKTAITPKGPIPSVARAAEWPLDSSTEPPTRRMPSPRPTSPTLSCPPLPPGASIHPGFDEPYLHERPAPTTSSSSTTTTWSHFLLLKAVETIELACVILFCSLLVFFMIVLPVFLASCALLQIWPIEVSAGLVFSYILWLYFMDNNSPSNGGWGKVGVGAWFCGLHLWDFFRSYFSARLVKTADLPTDKNYIFMNHPHGVYCLGTFANVTGNPRVFNKLYPGIKLRPTTLKINFALPVFREFLLSMGFVSVERKALEAVAESNKDSKTKGEAIVLVVGAAEEYTLMKPKTMDLVLKKRKGFAKLALMTGCSIVPILTFGENDIFERVESGFVKYLTKMCYRFGKFAFPAITGRWGTLIPNRVPLTTVIGAPLHVEKVEHPTEEQIHELHAKYLDHLTALYDEYKDIFFTDRVSDMRFVK